MLDLKGPNLPIAQARAIVRSNGVFSVSDFKNGDKELSPGHYTLETTSYFNPAWDQPSAVLALTGENGSKLSAVGLLSVLWPNQQDPGRVMFVLNDVLETATLTRWTESLPRLSDDRMETISS
jgi:hypothetical protein